MDNNIDFNTYLYISSKKIILLVSEKKNFQILLRKEKLFNDTSNEIPFKKIDQFLEENIYLIEKNLKSFISKVYLIFKSDDFFPIYISFKQKNYETLISQKNLNYLLNEAQNQCKKTMEGKKIIHMLVDDYLIDGEHYNFFPNKKKCNSFSVDVRFICLSKNLIKMFEEILKKYQISLSQILDANYLESFLNEEDVDIFKVGNKVIYGFNENEVKITDKILNKKGIFERFFDLFR